MSADDGTEHDPYVEALQAKLKKRSVGALPAALRDALSLLWAVSPRSTVLIVAAQLAAAVGMGAEVLLTKHALELLLQGQKLSATLPIFLALVVLNAVVRSVATIQTQHQALLGELVTRGTWERLLGVTTSVPLLTFEHADFYDRLQRIRSYSLTKPLQLAQGVIGLLGGGLGVVALVLALLSMQPLVLPISLAAAVPLLFLARLGGRIEFEFALAQTQNLRERFAVLDVLTERSSAKEVRAFSLQGFFRDKFASGYDRYVDAFRLKTQRRIRLLLLASLCNAAVSAAAITALLLLISHNHVSLAVAGAAVAAVMLLAGRVEQFFGGISAVLESGLYVQDINRFVALAEKTAPPMPSPLLDFQEITLENVSFAYPGNATPSLIDINLTLPKGRVLAVVGANGSGKTTLSKILGNLYAPSGGRVLWDGIEVPSLDQAEVNRSITVLFQDFERYELTLFENIAVGNPCDIENDERVRASALTAGADEAAGALPHGYSTFMSTRFPGGVDLSTGQWQRVAMARALFRDAPLVILDEPTASLDARAEAELYETMRGVLAGRTVVLVTHRLASARPADQIIVLDAGRVVEQGGHDELMRAAGYYAHMFTLQAAAYALDESTSPDGPGPPADNNRR